MNLFEKTKKLEDVKNNIKSIEDVIKEPILALAVDKLYFTDDAVYSTVYILVNNGDNLRTNLLNELELIKFFDNVIFDIVSKEYYERNLRNMAQLFYEA